MQDEQRSDGPHGDDAHSDDAHSEQQAETWQRWAPPGEQPLAAPGDEPGQAAPGQQGGLQYLFGDQPGTNQVSDPGADVTGPDAGPQPGASAPDAGPQPGAFTEPVAPPPGYFGQPGWNQQSAAEQGPGQSPYGPGYGQPGYGQPGYYGYQQGGIPPGGYGQPPGYPPQPPRRSRLLTAITYIAVAAVAAGAGGLVVALAGNNNPPAASAGAGPGGSASGGFPFGNLGGNAPNGTGNSGTGISGAAVRKAENAVLPGLVVINSNLKYQNDAAAATGMVISSNGLVLTNNHVIDQTTALTATTATGQHFHARWLGYDKTSDVAVIQLEGASALKTVPLGNSSAVKVGDTVVGMGNAGGTGNITSATGTITGLDQSITASDGGGNQPAEHLTGMLQTDASIVPGDSGGPLVNLNGQVVGMDTAASTSGSFQNSNQSLGFAIPINKAMSIARQIIAGQASPAVHIGSSGFIGVLVASGVNGAQNTESSPVAQLNEQRKSIEHDGIIPSIAGNRCLNNGSSKGLPAKVAPVSSGTLVLGSLCNTPADTAGLIPGDVITRVNATAVSSPSSLTSMLQTIRSGTSISLTWVTPTDHTDTRTITLAAAPPQ